MRISTNDAILCRNFSMPRDKDKHLPGWTPELNLPREQSLLLQFIWDACVRPREGDVADVMCHAWNYYH